MNDKLYLWNNKNISFFFIINLCYDHQEKKWKRRKDKMYDVCVIGAGPAGISSAVYAASRGMKTVVLEQKAIGGLLGSVSTVTHYAGILPNETGASFSARLKEQAEGAGVELVMEKVVKAEFSETVKRITTETKTYEAKTVILAAGTTPRKLGVQGEDRFAGRGTGLNPAKDAENYRGREMFVVGGADGAIKEALFLSGYASKVTVIHFEDALGAIPEFTSRVKETENIEVRLHSRLVEIVGEEQADGIVIQDEHTKELETIQAPGCAVFIYAGSTPNTALYPELETENGYVVTNERQETNLPGVYAAGDICVKQVRQAATAVSDGAVAGIQAATYIKTLS